MRLHFFVPAYRQTPGGGVPPHRFRRHLSGQRPLVSALPVIYQPRLRPSTSHLNACCGSKLPP